MAEINANTLPAKTDLGANDSAIVVDQTTNAGGLVDLDVLADKVLDRLTSKTFANQVGGSSAATLLAQLSTLNSKTTKVLGKFNISATATNYTLSGNITDYTVIAVTYYYRAGSQSVSIVVPVSTLTEANPTPTWKLTVDANNICTMVYVDATTVTLSTNNAGNKFVHIVGF